MLRPIKSMLGFSIRAEDGLIGHIDDLYFDDEHLTVRYLVVATGSWLSGKRVLISQAGFFGRPDWGNRQFPVLLGRDLVAQCPDADTDIPVSRQKEEQIARYYQWPLYWDITGSAAMAPSMAALPSAILHEEKEPRSTHLRSLREILGYRITATDGVIGHVADLIVDDDRWNIAFLVADVGSWLAGSRVLIAVQWIGRMSWDERSVHIELSRSQIKASPHFDQEEFIRKDYVKRLHDYYQRSRSGRQASRLR